MGYSVGDKVEVNPRQIIKGILVERVYEMWLVEILSMKPNSPVQLWTAKFTRSSHPTLIQESWITRKISSNFKGYERKTNEGIK